MESWVLEAIGNLSIPLGFNIRRLGGGDLVITDEIMAFLFRHLLCPFLYKFLLSFFRI